MTEKRARYLNNKPNLDGPVVYWMSRDQRVDDNWALLHAQQMANEKGRKLVVVFCLVEKYLNADDRNFKFMLEGLLGVEKKLGEHGIEFKLLTGEPNKVLGLYCLGHKPYALVCDFSPIKTGRLWRDGLSKTINCQMVEVDAHNIVPAWQLSTKQEWAAHTIRPKIFSKLGEFLTKTPKLLKAGRQVKNNDIKTFYQTKKWNIVHPITWIDSGEVPAHEMFYNFMQKKYKLYNSQRNDPTLDGQSNLSPYLHFGQISAQKIAYEVFKKSSDASKDAFFEEIVVRRELAENFCFYNPNYGTLDCFPNWAKTSLEKHLKDKREYIYSIDDLMAARTHDEAWNASQIQLVLEGKMHGYMRMYWAKKILEWSLDIKTAMQSAIYLNDKYELDGRDPNGYAGIAWSIGGVHDRPWFEREIFGQVRYMSIDGLKRKFDLESYIKKYSKFKV